MRSGQVLKTFTPEVIREEICSNSTLKILQLCLKGVMTDGTGSDLKSSLLQLPEKQEQQN